MSASPEVREHLRRIGHRSRAHAGRRLELRRQLGAREITVRDIDFTDPALASMRVLDFIARLPWRKDARSPHRKPNYVKAAPVLRAAGIPNTRTFRSLTDRQRSALVDAVEAVNATQRAAA